MQSYGGDVREDQRTEAGSAKGRGQKRGEEGVIQLPKTPKDKNETTT